MKEARQNDEVMQYAYRLFDRGNKGYISPEDVRTMMGILEEDITTEEVNQIIREVDPTGSGRIDFEGRVHVHVSFG
jgi:Ca2+-binding EF-hand superfamily protein